MKAVAIVVVLTRVASAQPDPVPPDAPAPAVTPEPAAPTLPPPPAVVAPEPLCIEGRPQGQCVGIGLAEIGLGFGNTTSDGGVGESGILTLQLGLLFNIGPRSAIGATLGIVAYDHPRATDTEDTNSVEGSFGGFVRYRHWLGDWWSVDLSVGAAKSGVIAEVAFQLDDMIAITAGAHTFPIDDDHELAATAGIRLGGYLVGAIADALAR